MRVFYARRDGVACRAGWSAAERGQESVAKPELLLDWCRRVPEDALVEFAWLTGSTPPVSKRQVVEDEQFAWAQADIDLDGL